MIFETQMLASPFDGAIPICLEVKGIGHIPSKKNKHYPGGGRVLMDKKTKFRMQQLESAILSALYSLCQIGESVTHSECLKQLRTRLSGLSDDSIREIPKGDWDVEYVPRGREGVKIVITELTR